MASRIEQLDTNFKAVAVDAGVCWYDVRELGVEGRGWSDTHTDYDRLPARAKGVVRPPVWELSQHSAGMAVHFRTNATRISVKWSLRYPSLAMNHMPATGVSGFDLYGRVDGQWRFAGVARPDQFPDNQGVLVDNMTVQTRQFLLYLPLYNGVTRVMIGLPEGAKLDRSAFADTSGKPIVCYGTSIVQGGCASRPGMAYPAILGRWLNWPTLNLGFSGNGQAEPEVAELLAELDPAAYVLDPLPNLNADGIRERMGHFVRTLRRARPTTPIVLVENVVYQQSQFDTARMTRWTGSNQALREVYTGLCAEGMPGIHYVTGERLFGTDSEATVDGTHATDVGFLRIAEALHPVLAALLAR